MTWLEIMDVLDRMPRHLLKEEAKVWKYDSMGKVEVLSVTNLVSPLSDGENADDPEWLPDGGYCLSLQAFTEDSKKPELREYTVKLRRTCNVSVMAEDPEHAQRIGEALAAKKSGWLYNLVQEVVSGCHDEFFGVSAAQDYCDLALSPSDCERIMGE